MAQYKEDNNSLYSQVRNQKQSDITNHTRAQYIAEQDQSMVAIIPLCEVKIASKLIIEITEGPDLLSFNHTNFLEINARGLVGG